MSQICQTKFFFWNPSQKCNLISAWTVWVKADDWANYILATKVVLHFTSQQHDAITTNSYDTKFNYYNMNKPAKSPKSSL